MTRNYYLNDSDNGSAQEKAQGSLDNPEGGAEGHHLGEGGRPELSYKEIGRRFGWSAGAVEKLLEYGYPN